MTSRKFCLVFSLLIFFLTPVCLSAQQEERLKEIDEYAQRAIKDWPVPGFSMAIVKDDKVVFAKGYGVRKLGEQTAVDERTLFAVASNTKAFTAALIGILVDEGKLKWDDPVTKYLPGFQLYDAYVTRELTIRDILSHRSGLETFGGDLLWYETTYDSKEVVRRIRFLKPTSSFRSRFGYQNIMFIAAGEIIETITGKPWDLVVKERILIPLGMTDTTTSIKDLKSKTNVATPHNELNDKMRIVRYGNVDGAAAAAGINSNAIEMAKWLRLQLGKGTYEGKKIFSSAVGREMWQPNTILPISEGGERNNPTRHFRAYGMGWFLSDYHGYKIMDHSGGLDGMISQSGMIPELGLGVVILSNGESSLPTIMMNKVFDVFIGAPKRDWNSEILARSKAGKVAAKKAALEEEAARAKDSKPSLALEKYAGSYSGPMYGEARIALEDGKLVLRLVPSPNLVADLEHWQYDTFQVKWRDSVSYAFGRGFVTFVLNAQGKVDEMKIDVPNPDFDFKELEFRRSQNERR